MHKIFFLAVSFFSVNLQCRHFTFCWNTWYRHLCFWRTSSLEFLAGKTVQIFYMLLEHWYRHLCVLLELDHCDLFGGKTVHTFHCVGIYDIDILCFIRTTVQTFFNLLGHMIGASLSFSRTWLLWSYFLAGKTVQLFYIVLEHDWTSWHLIRISLLCSWLARTFSVHFMLELEL